MSRRDEPEPTSSHYLGPLATSGDAELQGILLALQASKLRDQVIILSDSQASITSVHKLCSGEQAPRSGIEKAIKRTITERGRPNLTTGISWVRSHIGITGNELAGKAAGQRSFTGQLLSEPYTATTAGIRQLHKEARVTHRARTTLGLGRLTQWNRRALSAYTWTRTNRGPMRQWLFQINKIDNPTCTACQHHTQDGDHVVFHCPALRSQRTHLIGMRQGETWEDIDRPLWIKSTTEVNRQQDGTEAFFMEVFNFLT